MDHHSDFTYVNLLKYQTGDEAVKAKEAFEASAESHCVDIKHYHDDNGIFRSSRWMNQCKDIYQGLNLSGVNAHHQNGRVEGRIRQLQELSHCQMIHSHHQWTSEITSNL